MFGQVAIRLLKLMGHSGTVPSAIKADDVPDALAKLKKALQTDQIDDHDDEVSLKQRAYPLILLLQDAIDANCSVLWEAK
jgi:hypothetical protein